MDSCIDVWVYLVLHIIYRYIYRYIFGFIYTSIFTCIYIYILIGFTRGLLVRHRIFFFFFFFLRVVSAANLTASSALVRSTRSSALRVARLSRCEAAP